MLVDIMVAQSIARQREASLERRAEHASRIAEAERRAPSGSGMRRSVGVAMIRLGESLAGPARDDFGGAGGRQPAAG
ncbi:MAG TPA: hypothetical protein VFN57_06430 [Thermomicrobiaceae bacterium]|nr:hypothetical protein [Thermomicrobiaceae bacterium]